MARTPAGEWSDSSVLAEPNHLKGTIAGNLKNFVKVCRPFVVEKHLQLTQ